MRDDEEEEEKQSEKLRRREEVGVAAVGHVTHMPPINI